MALYIPQPLKEVWQPGKYSPIARKYQWSGTNNHNPLETIDLTPPERLSREKLAFEARSPLSFQKSMLYEGV
jgi:hypothetical protein